MKDDTNPSLRDLWNRYGREDQTAGLESLLVEKGVLAGDTVDEVLRYFDREMTPSNGARVVAKAWVDPEFKNRLMRDANSAVAELGITATMEGDHLAALENTEEVHNVVVCTLCSCYPWPILGLPPIWYKDPVYRSRVVREPRTVLREFGCNVDPAVEIRVFETSGHLRYFVIPERPPETENLNETELASLVTPESMVGVNRVDAPS